MRLQFASLAFIAFAGLILVAPSASAEIVILRTHGDEPPRVLRGTLSAMMGGKFKLEQPDGTILEIAGGDVIEVRANDIAPELPEIPTVTIPEQPDQLEEMPEVAIPDEQTLPETSEPDIHIPVVTHPEEEPDRPIVEEPPVVEQPTEDPAQPAVDHPPVEIPIEEPIVDPVAEPTEEPMARPAPAIEEHVPEVTMVPVQEQPIMEQPVVEQPVIEEPVVEEPAPAAVAGITGLWPLKRGARWVQDTGKIRREIEITVEAVDGAKRIYTESVTETSGRAITPKKRQVIVEERDGKTYYSRRDGRDAILVLVEPANVGDRWEAGSGYERVVAAIDVAYTDSSGTVHPKCVKIELQGSSGRTIENATQYYEPGVGMVSDHFVSYTPPKE